MSGDERMWAVWLSTSALIGLGVLPAVPHALARRESRFGLLALAPVAATLLAGAAAVSLAHATRDFWPLIARQALISLLTAAVLWGAVRPGVSWPTREDVIEVYRFLRGVLVFNAVNTLNRHADNVIVGTWLGETALGLYTLGYRVLTLPLSQVTAIATTLTTTTAARLAPDWHAAAEEIARAMRHVAMLITPFAVAMALAAPELITVLFGDAWMGALGPFRILALAAIPQAPVSQAAIAFPVSRRTDVMGRWGLVSTPAIVGSFVVGLPWGIDGVAASYAIVSLLLAIPQVRWSAGVLNVRPWLLGRGAVFGVAIGLVYASPIALTVLVSRVFDLSATLVVVSTGCAGAVSSLLAVRRIRAERAAANTTA
jgi:PST family polysaccharide transporter